MSSGLNANPNKGRNLDCPCYVHHALMELIRCSEADKLNEMYKNLTFSEREEELRVLKSIQRLTSGPKATKHQKDKMTNQIYRLILDLPSHKMASQTEKRREELDESPLFYFPKAEDDCTEGQRSVWVGQEGEQ